MRILYITILVVVACVTSLRAQNKSAIDQWIQKHVEAVTIYREGHTAGRWRSWAG